LLWLRQQRHECSLALCASPRSVTLTGAHAGKFTRHIDYWDAIDNQEYFSFEAFGHVLAQLGDLTRTPADLATPSYMVMRKFERYEIRRCDSLRLTRTSYAM